MDSAVIRSRVMSFAQFNQTIETALERLVESTSTMELRQIDDAAEVLRVMARRSQLGLEAQNRCVIVRALAERRIGQLLDQTARQPVGRPRNDSRQNHLFRLRDLGVTPTLQHRASRFLAIPDQEWRDLIERAQRSTAELSISKLLAVAESGARRHRNREHILGGSIKDLNEFAATRPCCGTILLDPPWEVPGVHLPYATMSKEAIRALPIRELANPDRCHLHIWVVPGRICRIAYDLIDFWGFRVVSEFCWTKRRFGQGNYYRIAHETCLVAVWAHRDDRFDHKGLRSWGEFPTGDHSAKPEELRRMIELASPAPRLELFARRPVTGWYSWGYEISTALMRQRILA
jgi:N6-adenosine-specific RNA methylase IME4